MGIVTIGMMRQVIQFDRPVKSSDNTGGQDEVYEQWFITRAYLKKERSFRSFETGYDYSIKTYKCWTPWRHELEQGITKDVRVIFENRSFKIDTFENENEKRRIVLLMLTEVR